MRWLWLGMALLLAGMAPAQQPAPPLPEMSGQVTLNVQDEHDAPARDLIVSLYYPQSRRARITPQTGLMLDLHNWGGTDLDGAPSPAVLVNTYNVVAIAVRYYQSGDKDKDPLPYDFGYRQTWDALRALCYVYQGLREAKIPFDTTRIYGTGGSGGGNVIQMSNKFAPRTFACIVDLSGMASLTDDIAYNLPGGSGLNARYSRDPASPAYLSKGMQEIRDLGNATHLALMAKLGNHCKVVVIHGEDDGLCLVADKKRVTTAMQAAGLDVETHFLGKADIDQQLVLNTGHSLGNRTALLQHFAGDYLAPTSAKMCRLAGPVDFDRRETIAYPTTNGIYTLDYTTGSPVLRYQPVARAPETPAEETLFGAYVPVWSPRFPAGYNETEAACGTLLTTSAPGHVQGFRFYKFAGTEHTMWLYNNDTTPPTLLATLQFGKDEETASGWQQKKLPAPIAITPGVHYMIWRACPGGENHGWTNRGKAEHGSNGLHLTGGGFYKGTVSDNAVTPMPKAYPDDVVDADVIFLSDR